MKITAKYLVIPVNNQTKCKKVVFYNGDGKAFFDFDAHIDLLSPEFNMYLNVERFRGMEFTYTVEPEMEVEFSQTDVKPMDGVYDSYLRPQVHFSAAYGWLNDPNGMVYHNGTYHLFFQHNPAGTGWGNMHWGHATSTDMIHWTETDIALYPDEMGPMFSGSAIIDKDNVSGLSENGDTILFYYTAAGGCSLISRGTPHTQCLAYSKDGGKTIIKYDKNPVVPHCKGSNRDPKVIWCEEIGAYVMALYLDWYYYRLFESKNLIDWTMIQDIVIKEEGETECPDIYPLEVDGERKWVLVGAHDVYVVGHFDKETHQFVAENEGKKFHYGTASYAAQTFSDVPDRRIKIAWNNVRHEKAMFGCQMGVPYEMSLQKVNDDYYLKGVPVCEFDTLVVKTESYKGCTKAPLSKTAAYDITIKAPKDAEDFTIDLFGVTYKIKPKANVMVYNDKEVPLSFTGGDIELRMITDTFTVECIMDGGLINAVFGDILDKNLNKLIVSSDAAEITVKELKSIWH